MQKRKVVVYKRFGGFPDVGYRRNLSVRRDDNRLYIGDHSFAFGLYSVWRITYGHRFDLADDSPRRRHCFCVVRLILHIPVGVIRIRDFRRSFFCGDIGCFCLRARTIVDTVAQNIRRRGVIFYR